MLEMIRHKIHGVFAWILLSTIAVVFIFWGSMGLRTGGGNYIDVNGKKIYPQDISTFKQVYPNADLVMIVHGIQQLNNAGFTYSDEQLDSMIQKSPMFQLDGKFSKDLYSKYMSNNLKHLEAVRTGVMFNSITAQMNYALQAAQVNFTKNIERYYKLMDQRRNVSVLTVPRAKFLKEVTVSEDEIAQYYENNKSKYIEPARIKLDYIKVHYPDIVKQIKLGEEDLKKYFDEHREQFVMPGQKEILQIVIDKNSKESKDKLEKIKQALKADSSIKSFGKLAKQYSDDKLTAKKMGNAGWFQVGDMGDAELDKALSNLTKEQSVSEIVLSNDNWYILKLVNAKAKSQLAYDDVKDDIKTRLSEIRANTVYSELKEQLERKSYEVADTLTIVAEELGVKLNKTDWLNKDGFIGSKQDAADDLLNNPKIIETAFSADVLENGNNSALIEINSETAVVIRVSEHQQAAVNDLDLVRNSVKASLQEFKATQKARDYAEGLWKEFTSNTATIDKLEKLGKNNKYVDFQKSKSVSYFDTFYAGIDGKMKQELIKAFELPKPSKAFPIQAKLLRNDNGDQSILVVDQVLLGEYQKASEQQRLQTANQLKYFMLMRDNAIYYNNSFNEAKIKSYM